MQEEWTLQKKILPYILNAYGKNFQIGVGNGIGCMVVPTIIIKYAKHSQIYFLIFLDNGWKLQILKADMKNLLYCVQKRLTHHHTSFMHSKSHTYKTYANLQENNFELWLKELFDSWFWFIVIHNIKYTLSLKFEMVSINWNMFTHKQFTV